MIDNLKALAATIEGKSLSVAAAKLFVTQSAISRRIQQLEEARGAPLFDRSQRPPVPTALGRRVYEQAMPILSAMKGLLETPLEGATPRGTLRLGLSPALGDVIPANAVKRIKSELPELDIRMRTEWGAGLSRKIGDGELDAAFLILPGGTEPASPLVGRRLAPLEVVVVQSRTDRQFNPPLPLSTLSRADWILNPVGCGYRASLETAMGDRGGPVRVAVDVYGSEIQLRMVASGLGLGLVPRAVLEASTVRPDVSVIPVTDFSINLDLWIASLGRLGNMKIAVDLIADAIGSSFVDRRTTGSDPRRRRMKK